MADDAAFSRATYVLWPQKSSSPHGAVQLIAIGLLVDVTVHLVEEINQLFYLSFDRGTGGRRQRCMDAHHLTSRTDGSWRASKITSRIIAQGFTITNTLVTGATCMDGKMLTGDSPLASSALGKMVGRELLRAVQG